MSDKDRHWMGSTLLLKERSKAPTKPKAVKRKEPVKTVSVDNLCQDPKKVVEMARCLKKRKTSPENAPNAAATENPL